MKSILKMAALLLLSTMINTSFAKNFSANVLAPNLVGFTNDVEENRNQWAKFESDLEKMKELGIQSISTNIWWSLVESSDNNFNWSYYKKLSEIIIDKGLKWSPIISFHSCKSNEDDCNIPLPSWVFNKYSAHESINDINDLKFISQSGAVNDEYISFWATEIVATEYKEFIQSFITEFNSKSSSILEIIVSLGPNAELRFPTNNNEVSSSAYSNLAKSSFRSFIKTKYKTIDNVNAAWESNLETIEDIQPPLDSSFYTAEEFKSNYGKDFYDWYNSSLSEHGIIVLTTLIRELNKEDSSFLGKPIGTIIPGSIWSPTKDLNRLNELNAGLIRSSDNFWDNKNPASGYDHIIGTLKDASVLTKFENLNIHLTSIEMTAPKESKVDEEESTNLAFEISKLAKISNLGIMGQNQSANVLGSNIAWDNIWNAVQNANYTGLTIKTMNDISENPLAYDFYKWIIENMKK
ncbi:putative beta-amylase precursor [Halobacteriovorax marinus SJ]|uniref:Beta-amylase n=1 Tax=Halobacteriovorax marinus (strain ATCC BAA-682 / DSM 15412 / SJ) TaxID=862908 RepID=E1WYL2_HALMS|nr:family 14 glycosylhydrolase [Halobacteriovorax marinus]CBW27652.1 putative beta-amylase precursor [Halobacteriovorax marinus SJ]